MSTSVRIFSWVIVYVHIHMSSMVQLRTTSTNFSFFAYTLFSFRDSWISPECQPNNGSVRKYLTWAGLNLYIHILRCIRAHVKYPPVVYARLFTYMSRRTTLNLPWIRVRMQRGRTGQLSIQVGQPRSSACIRLTLIFPILSSSSSLVFRSLHSSYTSRSQRKIGHQTKDLNRHNWTRRICRLLIWQVKLQQLAKLFKCLLIETFFITFHTRHLFTSVVTRFDCHDHTGKIWN